MALICVKASVAMSVCQVQSIAGVSSNTRQSEPREGKTQAEEGLWKTTFSIYPLRWVTSKAVESIFSRSFKEDTNEKKKNLAPF